LEDQIVENQTMTSKVSVVIPSYNNAKFLPEALESSLAQTYPAFEIIVVDDGSIDNTEEVCDRYPSVQYIYQKNQGIVGARNAGFYASTGDYLVFLDADDTLLPNNIEIGLNAIAEHPEAGFVFGNYNLQTLQSDGSYITEEVYDNQYVTANYENLLAGKLRLQTACMLIPRHVVEAVNAFDPRATAAEDYNFFLRIAREFPIHFHGQRVFEYRYNGGNLSGKPTYLINTVRCHHLQWEYIEKTGNPKYIAAYEEGRKYWIKLFADRLPYDIMRYLGAGQWAAALGSLRLMWNYDPKLEILEKEVYESCYKSVLSHLRKLPVEASLAYWKKQLVGAPALLALPTDRPRPAEQTFRGSERSFLISQKLTSDIGVLSQQAGVTPFMTLLAAFDVLLYRYTGTEDIIVGAPFADHDHSEVFVNAVPLRTDMSGNPSFQRLLRRVRKVALASEIHQDVPYCLLIDELNLPRDLSYSPLFQVTFMLEEDVPLRNIEISALTASPWVVENNAGKSDLTLFLKPTSEGLEGIWSYSTDLFDADTIRRLNEHFQILLQGIVSNPEQPISELPLLTAPEKQKLLVEWNNTQTDYPHEHCIHQLIAEQAERTPERIAVAFEGQTLTFKELNERANQLAHYLQKLGVQPDSLVGICVERSLEMMVGLVGILKAGGAYVPIDPKFPLDRVGYMLENAQAKVLLTQQHLIGQLPTQGALAICLDTDWQQIAQEPQTAPSSNVTPENIAYVIYTSGSTGKPKGVQVLHRGAVNLFSSMQQQPGINADDNLLSSTTISFDMAVPELFLPLIVGARIVLISRETAMDGRKLSKTISESEITIMQGTPASWRLLLETGWQGSRKMKILSGGEAISRELAAELLDKCAELWNLYGPTETTVWSTVHQVKANERRISIGKPIANTEVYILDALLQPVPIGVAGELHIGGTGVTKGYLKRPELTEERFIPNPFSDVPGAQIYKTGDLARYLPDGTIECLGRLDFQVKVRGFRIELGEIESVLVEHSNVKQAVVIVREDVPGDKRLVGYIVAQQSPAPTSNELRSLLRESVPEYMVPSAFVVLDALPLTPNGKVDRKVLPAPNPQPSAKPVPDAPKKDVPQSRTPEPIAGFVAPQDDLDIQIIRIWEKVLNVSSISMRDNFFELGGHSLLAVSLLTEIEKIYKKELPLSVLFQSPTVQQLGDTLREKGCASSSQALVTIQKGGSKPPLFCIYGVFLYHALAKHLGEDQPVYGVYLQEEVDSARSDQSGASSAGLLTVADMASRYLKEVQAHQPAGPYFLAGESLGGLVALEMARKLLSQGEEVAFLGMLDSAIPGKHLLSLTQRLRWHGKNLLEKGLPYLLDKVAQVFGRSPQVLPGDDGRVAFRTYAFDNYEPQSYPGKAVLFRAMDESHYHLLDGWNDIVAGGLEIQDVPGDHLGILREPNVQILAEKLKAYIPSF
jgi:amino acid adenylation domain-containing protein